uniref:Uncharacterized protein n=1 Tax=Pyrodinium bahamense TaxID=73915 RepID=A0A7S0AUF8_9DINO
MAASQRESLMRQLCRYQFAPEVVEVEETDQPGCFKRRRFTDTLKTGQAQISMALKSQALSVTNPNRLSMLASLRTRVARALQARRLRAVPAGPASFA